VYATVPSGLGASALESFYQVWRAAFLSTAQNFSTATERHLGATAVDRKSFFDFVPAGNLPPEIYNPTRWLFDHLVDLVQLQPQTIETALSMAPGEIGRLGGGRENAVLRVSRYEAPRGEIVGSPHKDMDLLTLLPWPTAPGLEVFSPEGWAPADISHGSVLILRGEMLEAIDGAAATVHRVVSSGGERMSVSLFLNAKPDLRLRTGQRAGDALKQRINDIVVRERKP
jgi:hypothetical protein